ncbi:MAG: hypothetical protein WAO28_04640 [Candidatus Microsaccharimonas sp.]
MTDAPFEPPKLELPETDTLTGFHIETLKYGEDQHITPAGLYVAEGNTDPLALTNFKLVEGTTRSLVGVTDANRLLQVITHIAAGIEVNFGYFPLIAVGVKHGNPCGVAVGRDAVDVVTRMVAGDKRAIFGGVIMTNFAITPKVAEALMAREEGDPRRLFDGIYAPSVDDGVIETLERRNGKCRIMTNPALEDLDVTSLDTAPRRIPVRGGWLLQPNYTFVLEYNKSVRYGPAIGYKQRRDLIVAWAIGSTSNSNTITIVRDGQLLGNGVGQQDRVGAAELAVKRALDAGHDLNSAVAYSDSFFPQPDGVEVLANAGIKAIFTSSGSQNDNATIETCKRLGVTLLMQPDENVRGFAWH